MVRIYLLAANRALTLGHAQEAFNLLTHALRHANKERNAYNRAAIMAALSYVRRLV